MEAPDNANNTRKRRVRIKLNDVEVEVESDNDNLNDVKQHAEDIARKIKRKDFFSNEYIG